MNFYAKLAITAFKKTTYWRNQEEYSARKAADLSLCRISLAMADCTTCWPRLALRAERVRWKAAGPKRRSSMPPRACSTLCWRTGLTSLMVWYLRSVGSCEEGRRDQTKLAKVDMAQETVPSECC